MKRLLLFIAVMLSMNMNAQSSYTDDVSDTLSYDEFMSLLFLGSYSSADTNPNRVVYNTWDVVPTVGDCTNVPPYSIYAKLNYSVDTTFVKDFYVGYHQAINVSAVKNSDDYIMFCFYKNDPSIFSTAVSTLSSSVLPTGNSIVASAPQAGYYTVVIIPIGSVTAYCDVSINGAYYTKQKIHNKALFLSIPNDETTYNIFTWGSTCQTALIALSAGGTVIAYNTGYTGTGDIDWSGQSRIKQSFSQDVVGVIPLILPNSSIHVLPNPPLPQMDVYAKCSGEFTHFSNYPNLNADDVMITAPATSVYNCLDWAFDEWIYWPWPQDVTVTVESFDRMLAVHGYTRSGATEANSIVDLWRGDSTIYSQSNGYCHVSVKAKSNPRRLGYGWESKLGHWERIMHPRYALEGYYYGSVVAHYRRIPGFVANFVYENYELNTEEVAQIRSEISHVPSDVVNSFDICFNSLNESFNNSPYSDPNVIRDFQDYDTLLKIFETTPSAKYLLFLKVHEAEVISIPILQDVVIPDYEDILQVILSENKANRTTTEGANIIYTNLSVASKLISGILYKEKNRTTEGLHWNGSTFSNDESVLSVKSADRGVVVDFSLSDDAIVSLQLSSSVGNVESSALKRKGLGKGSYHLNIPVSQKGMYVVRLIVNGRIYSRKIMIN